jgi:hypothetical protein
MIGAVMVASADAWLQLGRHDDGSARSSPTSLPSSSVPASATGSPGQWSPLAPTALATAEAGEEALPGTPDWQVGSTAGRRAGLDAFADQVSVRPGDPVRLFISSTTPAVRLRALRIGDYARVGARQVWAGSTTATRQRTAVVDNGVVPGTGGLRGTHQARAPWTPTTTLDTAGWPEGHYLLRLDAGTASRYVPLTVRSSTGRGRVVVMASPMTWQAYNSWGGTSLYGDERTKAVLAQSVSFDRPYSDGFGSGRFLTYDSPLASAVQAMGLPVAWVTDLDLARHPDLLDGAAALVVGGHAEYWTAGLRDTVEKAVAGGTNLAVFGANTAYWRVRLAGERVLVTTKAARLDPLAARDPHGATARFRDAPAARPEELLTGMRYDCFPAEADWVVTDATWWGYAGTGLRDGQHLRGLVGPEADRVYPAADRPTPEQVVAYTRYPCGGRGGTAHTGVYWVAPSGAGVFVAGTMRWPCALDVAECRDVPSAEDRRLVRAVTREIVTGFAEQRAGRTHPAVDTVGRYWLPARSTTGAS